MNCEKLYNLSMKYHINHAKHSRIIFLFASYRMFVAADFRSLRMF